MIYLSITTLVVIIICKLSESGGVVGELDGKIFGSIEIIAHGYRYAWSVRHDREPNLFSHPARPNFSHGVFYHMTNLETLFFKF